MMSKWQLARYFDWLKILVFLGLAMYIFYFGQEYHQLSKKGSIFLSIILAAYALFKIYRNHLGRGRYRDQPHEM